LILLFLISLILCAGCGELVKKSVIRSGKMKLYGAQIVDIYLVAGEVRVSGTPGPAIEYGGTIEVMANSEKIIDEAIESELFLQVVAGKVAMAE
jgi:hypothetical protein